MSARLVIDDDDLKLVQPVGPGADRIGGADEPAESREPARAVSGATSIALRPGPVTLPPAST